MSSVYNKGTQYDPPGNTETVHSSKQEKEKPSDVENVSSDDEPQIVPPRISISITPRARPKSGGARHMSRNGRRRCTDTLPNSTERTSGSIGEIPGDNENHSRDPVKSSTRTDKPSANADKHSADIGKPSSRDDKPSANSGNLSRVIGKHTRTGGDDTPVAWTADYRNKPTEEDRLTRLQITAHNSHPLCFKPATAAGLTRRFTLGNYLPNLSSVQFVVKNEVNFWPSAVRKKGDERINAERAIRSRQALRGTGVQSARLRTDEERRLANSCPPFPAARKSNIITNRVPLVSRSAERTRQPATMSFPPASAQAVNSHRPDVSRSVPALKLSRLQRYYAPKEDLTHRGRPPSPASDASDPTPSEVGDSTGKVRAWITHRERLPLATPGASAPSTPRGLWETGMSPAQRDMMLPLRKAHPTMRSTLTVGNFWTDGTASKGVAARVTALQVGGVT